MKYEQPIEREPTEIINILERSDTAPADRLSAVLSAVFYAGSLDFSGDILIKEFSSATYSEKIHLKNIFETFYGMNQTTYRIDESISLLEEYKKENLSNALEIGETIDALKEYKEIFN